MNWPDLNWRGRLAFGPWWFLYSGPIWPSAFDEHHAPRVIVHDGHCQLVDQHGGRSTGVVVISQPVHRYHIVHPCDHAIVVFVAPSSTVELAVTNRAPPAPQRRSRPLDDLVRNLEWDTWSRADELVRRALMLAGAEVLPAAMHWWRHAALEAALRQFDRDERGRVDLVAVSKETHLSPEFLTDWSQALGMSLPQYLRWLAMIELVERLADAAPCPGFRHRDPDHWAAEDFAHWFGLTPAEALQSGSLVR